MPREFAAGRIEGVGTTVFAEMSALALATGSINLGQGFPDTDGPSEVLEAAVAAIREGRNQYPPGLGVPELRAAIAEHQRRFYDLDYDADTEVLVTAGATEGITAALLALVDPGDEVVVLEPYYDSYVAAITFAGGVRRPVTLRPPAYAVDPHELRAAITSQTKVLLVNTPHNPTGAVLSRTEVDTIAEVANAYDLVVLSDEVYEHLALDEARPHVALGSLAGMRERTLSFGSAGKTFAVTGWKVGWVCGPPQLVRAVMATKQFMTYTNAAPLQPAVAVGLGLPDAYFEGVRDELRARRDQLTDGLRRIGLDAHASRGTYFVTTDVRAVGYASGVDFCRDLPKRAGVVAIPHAPFWDHSEIGGPLVRWAFCKRAEVIDDALDRLSSTFG
ncbi:MAG: pyridoxal phosphate-dependent aminotransferase [Candidatus Nanopelagicales bacterium]